MSKLLGYIFPIVVWKNNILKEIQEEKVNFDAWSIYLATKTLHFSL